MPIPASSVAPALDELKAHLNIASSTHDDELQAMLDAAVEVVEGYVGPLDGETVTEAHYSLNPGLPVLLRQYPILSVDAVVDANGETLDADTYTVDLDTARVWLSRWSGALPGWAFWGPRLIDVTVTYTTGRAQVPQAILTAVLIVAARLWETQRGAAPSALPVSEDPTGFDPAGQSLLPVRARELLQPYLRSSAVA